MTNMKMGWEKNVCSYILWLLYTISAGTVLILAIVRLGIKHGIAGVWGAIAGILLLLVEGVVTAAICLFLKRQGLISHRDRIWRVAEGFSVSALLVAGVFLRWQGIGNAGQKANYFHMAYVSETEKLPKVAHGIVACYLRLLHAFFYVLGNKLSVGVGLQILLQLMAILFIYLAVRRLSGVVAALVMLSVLAFSPTMIYEAQMLSPEMIFLFFFGAGILVVSFAACVKRDVKWIALAGMTAGFVGQMDALGLALLVLLVAMLLWDRGEAALSGGESVRLIGAAMCGCLATFLILMGAEALFLGRGLKECLRAWKSLHIAEKVVFPIAYFDGTVSAELTALAVLLCIGVFTFWYSRKEYIGPWLLMAFAMGLAGCVGMTSEEISSVPCLYVLAAIVAGIGVEGLFAMPHRKAKEKRAGISRTAYGDTEGEILYQATEPEETGGQTMEGYEGNTDAMKAAGEQQSEALEQISAIKPQMLDNPLPVPKRQKKPALDYDLLDIKGKEFYDVSVKNDDDFDIQ